jgi:hypothetical protein
MSEKSGWMKHRRKRLLQGLCRDCGLVPFTKGRFTCETCAKRACDRVKKQYALLRIEVLTKYCGGTPYCQCPGCNVKIIEFLNIDHIYGDGAEHRKELGIRREHGQRIGGRAIIYWLRENNYPDGFQVLCANCNKAKDRKQFCPRRDKSHEF